MQITIIGAAGRMGAWFTRYFLSRGDDVFVHDLDKPGLQKLKKAGATVVDDLKKTVVDSDAVMICVPINTTKRAILQVSKHMMIGSTLIEISSIKHGVHKTLAEVARLYSLKPLCIHPLFGPGAEGIKNMRVAVIPVIKVHAEMRNARKLFAGALLVTVDVDEHDKMIAVVLGLTHLMNAILARILADENRLAEFQEVAGTTFKLQSLLTQSIMNDDVNLFTSLIMSNPYTRRHARNLMNVTQQLCNYVINENPRGLANAYTKTRDKIAAQTKLEKSYETMYEVLKSIK